MKIICYMRLFKVFYKVITELLIIIVSDVVIIVVTVCNIDGQVL